MNESIASLKTDRPSDKKIGQIEPVFKFYDAMPTGVSVSLRRANLYKLSAMGR